MWQNHNKWFQKYSKWFETLVSNDNNIIKHKVVEKQTQLPPVTYLCTSHLFLYDNLHGMIILIQTFTGFYSNEQKMSSKHRIPTRDCPLPWNDDSICFSKHPIKACIFIQIIYDLLKWHCYGDVMIHPREEGGVDWWINKTWDLVSMFTTVT